MVILIMKHILYFLFIWFLIGALIGSFGFGLIALIDHIPIKEVMGIYDKKLSYIFVFQCLGIISTLVTIFIFLKKEEIGILDIGLRLESGSILWKGLFFGAIPVFFIGFILYLKKDIRYSSNAYDKLNILIYFFVLIIGSLNEEILTRGYVLRNLMLRKNKYLSLLYSSVLFALFHINNDNLSVMPFINIFLAGIFFGLFYIYFKNLWFSIFAHFAWNFVEGPILGSAVSGLKTDSIFKQIHLGKEIYTGGAFGFEASIICSFVLVIFIGLLYLFCEKSLKKNLPFQNKEVELAITAV